MRRRVLLSCLVLAGTIAASGCVFRTPPSRTPGTDAVVVPGVPLLHFVDDDCGAGSLATLLAYWDVAVPADRLAERLPTVRRGEVLSVDLLIAAREHGLDAHWTVGDEAAVAAELRARRPVILLLRVANAPGTRRDYYHYVVADGHDEANGLVRILLGDGTARWIPFARLERPWRGAGHALLRARPASTSPEVLEARALAAEAAGEFDVAAGLYRELLETRAQSPVTWTNLGNALAAGGRPIEAERAYRRALELDPRAVDAANNLAWLLLQRGEDLAEAERLARLALEAASDPQRLAAIRDTLERILDARGAP